MLPAAVKPIFRDPAIFQKLGLRDLPIFTILYRMVNWYGNHAHIDSCNFGPLALIYPLLERMQVEKIVDIHLPKDPQAEYSHGQILSLLIAARLYSPVALSNVAEWATESGADILWNIPPEKLNDDRLGRSLDAFFQERHSILAHIATTVAQEFKVSLNEVHYDPTHILFHGDYESSQSRVGVIDENTVRSDAELAPAHITKGRATDDAPDGALMIHAGLCTVVDRFGPLPFFGHTVDGNQNGHTAVAEQFALMQKHLQPQKLTMYSDRGTFSAGMLRRLWDEGMHAVCSVPWGDFRDLFEEHRKSLSWERATYLSIEQRRRRESNSQLPQEHYELAVLKHEIMDADNKKLPPIPVRVIFVFSTADQKVVQQQRQKQIEKIKEGLKKLQQSVDDGNRNTDPRSVNRRIEKILGKKDAAKYFSWQMVPLTAAEKKKLPPVKRGGRTPTHRLIVSFDEAAVEKDEQYDGYSAIVTSVPQKHATADQLFTNFKQQNYSEHVNRQFKGPIAVSPVFLHASHRVEALVFLLMISLISYFLLQRLYRQSVSEEEPIREQRMTSQSLFRTFRRYTLLLHKRKHGREVQTTRLTLRQAAILQKLGFPSPAKILSNRLPRAPT